MEWDKAVVLAPCYSIYVQQPCLLFKTVQSTSSKTPTKINKTPLCRWCGSHVLRMFKVKPEYITKNSDVGLKMIIFQNKINK